MAERDYYEILGVSKTASEDEIKKILATKTKKDIFKSTFSVFLFFPLALRCPPFKLLLSFKKFEFELELAL